MTRGTPWEDAYGKGKCFVNATGVEAFFQSLEAKSSSRICMGMIVESSIIPQTLDLEEALLHLVVNEENCLDPCDLDDFREHLPLRKNLLGKGPTIKNELLKNVMSWTQNAKNSK